MWQNQDRAFMENLLARIARDFAEVPRPGSVTKSVARGLDDEWRLSDERHAELFQKDHETHWQELSDQDLREFGDVLPFLDEEGWLFYLPAFMSLHLRRALGQAAAGSGGGEHHLIYACSSPVGQFSRFTPAQMRCVIDYLTLGALDEGGADPGWAAYAVDLLGNPLNAPPAGPPEETLGVLSDPPAPPRL